MDSDSLLAALSGGLTYREKSGLPESEDVMKSLMPIVKEDLLKLAAKKLLSGNLLGAG